jgi:peptidoglycan/xylan/chitin deacetylase (PgdA/CDA1 family)
MRANVPILMYHRLFDGPQEVAEWPRSVTRFWVPVRAFEQQIAALAAGGYTAVSLASLLSGSISATGKSLVLTFDDGWASDWHLVRPRLARVGWRSEHFVTAGWIGRRDFLSWAQVRALDGGQGRVHSHTMTHPDLDALSDVAVHEELTASRATLERVLERPVRFLALPGGTGTRASIVTLARLLGYRAICTSRIGLNGPRVDPFALRRLPVTRGTSVAQLLDWVEGRRLRRLALARGGVRVARRLLGPHRFEAMKERLLGSVAAG